MDDHQIANCSSMKASEKSAVSKRVSLEMNSMQEVLVRQVLESDVNGDSKISSYTQQKSATKVVD